MGKFLSGIALLLSVIALGGAGFVLAQTFQLQQSFRELNASVQKSPIASELPQVDNSPTVSMAEPIQITNAEPNQQAKAEIQPGQFVQYAFKDEAQVELLSVNRIQNPENNVRDVVNIRMRFRRLKKEQGTNIITLNETKARNPETNETYESYHNVIRDVEKEQAKREGTETDHSKSNRSSGSILMTLVKQGSSVDSYVWMSIPEEVKSIDLFVPKTAAFLKVPISE
jgi:hypothetical protein